jgi:Ca2+-transporting ATPase
VYAVVPGRVRLRHPGLVQRDKLARRVAVQLRELPGIFRVQSSALTGSVLVEFGSPVTIASSSPILNHAGRFEITAALLGIVLTAIYLLVLAYMAGASLLCISS